MSGLTFTLVGDGPSDRLLEYPIRWALASLGVAVELGQWADLWKMGYGQRSLSDRLRAAMDFYPAELLLVHRDAENVAHDVRADEISRAVRGVTDVYVAVIPVRMTEAWLLHDEGAIRRASGNPNGRVVLDIPDPSRIEFDVDPKATLERALLAASELTGRRRQKRRSDFAQMRARTAELITDFQPLFRTPAFSRFVEALREAVVQLGHLE